MGSSTVTSWPPSDNLCPPPLAQTSNYVTGSGATTGVCHHKQL